VPKNEFYTASMATVMAAQLGPFGHRPEVLSELLAGRRVALQHSEGAYARTLKGSASPHDLDVLLQLLHLGLCGAELAPSQGDEEVVMLQVRYNTVGWGEL
jgi:hypothetical protein